ncbi:MAG: response regulator [Proteobacteria bacterium]|nr:response regulator [Pseudomonadota bacterium]
MEKSSSEFDPGRFYDKLDLGVVILDGDLSIRYMNRWLKSHLPPGLVEVKSLAALFRGQDCSFVRRLVRETIRTKSFRVLSQVFHSWILPLPDRRFPNGLMRQGCSVIPFKDSSSGETLALIQLRDDSDRVLQIKKLNQEKLTTEKINRQLQQEIAERKEAEERLRKLNQQLGKTRESLEEKAMDLEMASQYKSEFLANLSHELRTPLNSMLILSEILVENAEGNLTEDQRKSARIFHASSGELLELINEILDLAKVEAGKMTIVSDKVLLGGVKWKAEQIFENIAREKGIDFKVAIEPKLPGSILTDGQRLNQIIRNLLSNAFKFTTQGSVSLIIDRPNDGVDLSGSGLVRPKTVAFSVSDSGIGIPGGKLEEIFNAFQQVDGSTSRKYGGTGLGLSISREFSRLLGGEIQVASEPGVGSAFTLYLPEVLPGETESIPVEPKDPSAENHLNVPATDDGDGLETAEDLSAAAGTIERDLKGKTLLLVDDDMRNVFSLKKTLERRGIKVVVGIDGKTGLEQLEKNPDIDLVLMDMTMPAMDGYKAMREIRKQVKYRKLPIIAVTARVMKGDEAKTIEAGATDYLLKPVDIEKLFSILATWL